MKTLFTAEAVSKGGRSGTVQGTDGLLNVTLGNPLEEGIEKRGPNPELLFAGAYSACYHGALLNAAKKLGTPVQDSKVRALISLIEETDVPAEHSALYTERDGAFFLDVEGAAEKAKLDELRATTLRLRRSGMS